MQIECAPNLNCDLGQWRSAAVHSKRGDPLQNLYLLQRVRGSQTAVCCCAVVGERDGG